MILQALVEHYEDLAAQGKLARPGWSDSKISYALYINDAGELEQAVSLKTEEVRGKKSVWVPRLMSLPAPVKRSSGIASNFLWDNSSYILGIDEKSKPQRSLECFAECKAHHHRLLDSVDSPAARALLAFFDSWDPAKARERPALADKLEEILAGANLVFRYDGDFLQNDPLIQAAWQAYYDGPSEGPEMVCLVTGEKGPVEAVHPPIMGVVGAQSSGAALVSFNGGAFCSYGHEQSLNAPVSKYAAFAYTSALNHLLADREYVGRIGDTTVLFWAKGGQPAYQGFFMGSMFGGPTSYTASDLQKMTLDLCQGNPVTFDEALLDPNTTFYILGLSPNAARLSVRFFLRDSFGNFAININKHYGRLSIVRTVKDKFDTLYIPTILGEVINQDSKLYDKLFGETLVAVLKNSTYPATLRNLVHLHIRASRDITRPQAAILKACLSKKCELSAQRLKIMEVVEVELNENCTYPPYLLGRLFSVMEQIQLASADWKLNRTIKNSYFTSVTATPKNIFAKLFPLNEYHMEKLKRDKKFLARNLEVEKNAILAMLTTPIPTRFTPDEVDCFYIGYYHQNCKKGTENNQKEETEHV